MDVNILAIIVVRTMKMYTNYGLIGDLGVKRLIHQSELRKKFH